MLLISLPPLSLSPKRYYEQGAIKILHPILTSYKYYQYIYQDITENNRDNNKYMELQCVLSKQNVYDDMTDKEFIKDIVSHFKKGLWDWLKEREEL